MAKATFSGASMPGSPTVLKPMASLRFFASA